MKGIDTYIFIILNAIDLGLEGEYMNILPFDLFYKNKLDQRALV